MISERMDHTPFDDTTNENDIDQSIASNSHTRKSPIDILPIELLERVICMGAAGYLTRPKIKWIFEWRGVSRKWASVIDCCPALWSYIEVSDSVGHVPTQLAKSKGAPLIIELESISDDEEWIRLLVDNVHRWKSISLYSNSDMEKISAILDFPPPMLEDLEFYGIHIPSDSKFFNPPSPNLRVLELRKLTIPSNIQPIFGLEELRLYRVYESLEDGTLPPISVRKLHQFLQASPGLQVLGLAGDVSASAADKSLQPVNLPNLEELGVQRPVVLNLFRAEHCADLTVSFYLIKNELSRGVWTTVVPTLRRAQGLEVDVSKDSLRIVSLVKPPTIRLSLHLDPPNQEEGTTDLSYSILEEILQELENESCISARIQLSLYPGEDIGAKVLKLLQSPMPGPSSRWRLPHLDTVRIHGEGFPYQSLQAFVQARANAQGAQAPNAVTRIFESYGHGIKDKEILGEVMDYA